MNNRNPRPTSRGFLIVNTSTGEILSDLSLRREPLRDRLRNDFALAQIAGIHQVKMYPGETYDPATYNIGMSAR